MSGIAGSGIAGHVTLNTRGNGERYSESEASGYVGLDGLFFRHDSGDLGD